MIIKSAGFITSHMIRSKNALNFAYICCWRLEPARIYEGHDKKQLAQEFAQPYGADWCFNHYGFLKRRSCPYDSRYYKSHSYVCGGKSGIVCSWACAERCHFSSDRKTGGQSGRIYLGALEGLLTVYIVFAILIMFSASPKFQGVFEAIESSTVAKVLYHNNFIVDWMFPKDVIVWTWMAWIWFGSISGHN